LTCEKKKSGLGITRERRRLKTGNGKVSVQEKRFQQRKSFGAGETLLAAAKRKARRTEKPAGKSEIADERKINTEPDLNTNITHKLKYIIFIEIQQNYN
jgi:hypothetical protein